jgi:putative Ca2+/H+ antiporter (TMEM165/GDT1 family)
MALSYRARRAWTFVILLIGLPVYVVLAVTLADWARDRLGRPAWWIELVVFVVLGLLWALPFRAIFRGVGRDDPDRPPRP